MRRFFSLAAAGLAAWVAAAVVVSAVDVTLYRIEASDSMDKVRSKLNKNSATTETAFGGIGGGDVYTASNNVFTGSNRFEGVVILVSGAVAGDIVPAADSVYDLGASNRQWKSVWVSSNTVYIGGSSLTITNGILYVNGVRVQGDISAGSNNVFTGVNTFSNDVYVTNGSLYVSGVLVVTNIYAAALDQHLTNGAGPVFSSLRIPAVNPAVSDGSVVSNMPGGAARMVYKRTNDMPSAYLELGPHAVDPSIDAAELVSYDFENDNWRGRVGTDTNRVYMWYRDSGFNVSILQLGTNGLTFTGGVYADDHVVVNNFEQYLNLEDGLQVSILSGGQPALSAYTSDDQPAVSATAQGTGVGIVGTGASNHGIEGRASVFGSGHLDVAAGGQGVMGASVGLLGVMDGANGVLGFWNGSEFTTNLNFYTGRLGTNAYIVGVWKMNGLATADDDILNLQSLTNYVYVTPLYVTNVTSSGDIKAWSTPAKDTGLSVVDTRSSYGPAYQIDSINFSSNKTSSIRAVNEAGPEALLVQSGQAGTNQSAEVLFSLVNWDQAQIGFTTNENGRLSAWFGQVGDAQTNRLWWGYRDAKQLRTQAMMVTNSVGTAELDIIGATASGGAVVDFGNALSDVKSRLWYLGNTGEFRISNYKSARDKGEESATEAGRIEFYQYLYDPVGDPNYRSYFDTNGTLRLGYGVTAGVGEKLYVNGDIGANGHIRPAASNAYDLGSTNLPWRSLYVSTNTVYLGKYGLSVDNSKIAVSDGTNAPVDYATEDWTTNYSAQFGGVSTINTLTYSGTNVATDATVGCFFRVTLTNDVVLVNPSGAVDGQRLEWWITQGGGGGKTLTLGSKFRIPSSYGMSGLTLSTTNGTMDKLSATYDAVRDKFDIGAFVKGY